MATPTMLGTGFVTKPRWDKYDGYVGNFRAPLAADVVLATQANRVLPVGIDSNGAAVLGGAGQTGIVGVAIIPVGTDMAGNLLDGGVNTGAGDIVDVGKHGEITNFSPTPVAGKFTLTVKAQSGNVTVKVNGVATGNIAYNTTDPATVKAALVAVDDSFAAADFTVTGSGPFTITTKKGIVISDADTDKTTVTAASTTAAAGTNYYAHPDGSVDSTAGADGVYVGHTVEADRLIVNVVESLAAPGGAATDADVSAVAADLAELDARVVTLESA